MYEHIEQPLQVGPLQLRRRVYLPAHQPGLAKDGKPTEEYIAYHRARARAGAAMQVTGANPISPSAEWSGICLWNIDDSIIPGYRAVAQAVHEEGGLFLAQLAHPGPTEFEGREVFGPSLDFSEVSQQVAVPASREQLAKVVADYAAAARRCAEGNLDGVEISMAHGLLLGAFLSPLMNHRDDEYGGSFENILRLPREVLRAVKEAISPNMALGIRLGADDLVPGGMTPQLAAEVARALEPEVDYISVMVGNNNRREARVKHWAPTPMEHGGFRDVGREVCRQVSKPVAIVGRITELSMADDIIRSGDADLVGMVRAQIADAQLIPLSLKGEAAKVRPCVGANVCVDTLLADKPLRCMVNPDVGDSRLVEQLPSLSGRSALVVGGGPAGLESARRLALRGAEVTLIDRNERLGGAMLQWTNSVSRREFRDIITWQADRLEELGVTLRLGTEFSADVVREVEPDHIVAAAGAAMRQSAVPGDASVELLPLQDLENVEVSGRRIVVHDVMGRLGAVWLAERLKERGASPVITTSRLHAGEGEGVSTLYPALRRVAELGIETHSQVELKEVSDGSLCLSGSFGGADSRIQCDAYINLDLLVPNRLVGGPALPGPMTTVGDAARPRDVASAFADARELTDVLL
ncbi:oxidoreductase [Brevibacterium daeguense]|uniref:oxidoreductase n=1 Tax=Brevibacterium daeguense TaxID=909936 RepID=UPI001F2BBD70|nr:NAD(P)-binding protein [Brevibacterium daeguense]